ncbi:MAG TPA: sialidase family protein [Gaiellaceae bacterium]|nr:sialidase family protein [Gaiellaceae bacterium]
MSDNVLGRGRGLTRLPRLVAVVAFVALGVAAMASADTNPQPVNFTHNVFNAPSPVAGTVWSQGPNVKTGTAICSTPTSAAANVNTDCEENGPHNETSIAVNPTNTNNMVGGVNDYQLSVNPGGHLTETILSRAHVTFDGGKSWAEYPIFSTSTYTATGDPSLAFDASGRAYYGTLGFRFVSKANVQNADVLVATSADGGKTWAEHRIAQGTGVATSVGASLDKEYVAAWGNGNAIVTWGDFVQVQKGNVVGTKLYDSVTHDGGKTWSAPTLISGSLDQGFVATPTVTSDGKIFVSFLNTWNLDPNSPQFGQDNYMVVQVSPQTGAPLESPQTVAGVVDGNYDNPWNTIDGRPTYQDSMFRTWAAGNITSDPTDPNHLALVWSDMRDTPGLPFTPFASPYSVSTNSDVVVSESTDGGATWSTPTAIELPGDQFMPWAAFDGSGTLRIGFFDRAYDRANHKYGYTIATETSPGVFSTSQLSTALSDPTTNDRWFARNADSAFPNATGFLGDYSNIAAIPGTASGVVAYWTDMRLQNCWNLAPSCGRTGEDAFFAKTG